MVNRIGLISILLIILIIPSRGQSLTSDQTLRDEVMKYGQVNVTIPYPGLQAIDIITRNVSITSVREGKVYISLSKLTVDWFIAQKLSYTMVPRTIIKGLVSAASVSQAMQWQSYPTYTQYDSIMRSFAISYPSLCRLDTIGTSIDGRLVLALKISDNVSLSEPEPQVFYSSTIHGDEVGGFVLMLRLADYLLKNYSTDARARNLVDNLEIWINPLANPDGTYTTGNTITNAVRFNADGVDLNRNFPDPMQAYSPEKETIDMVNFMKGHKFVISANFHAGDEVVNYPWDRWPRLHADDSWFNHISRAYADTVHIYSPAGYLTDLDNGVTNGYAWYSVYGGRQDYMTYSRQGREVTIELDYNKVTPGNQLDSLWNYNWRSLLGYLENALYGIHGYVKDANTSAPVAAEVYIKGHDVDSSQDYSDSQAGGFTRLLMPGTWNISFSANGYRDTTIANLLIEDRVPLNLTAYMEPLTSPVDTTYPFLPFLWPNPATSTVKCILPEKLYGSLKVTIIDQTGKKAMEFNQEYFAGDKLEFDVSGLAAGLYYVTFRNLATGFYLTSQVVVMGRFH